MAIERIFYISANALTVYLSRGREPRQLASFPASIEGQAAFSAYLAEQRDQLSLVLVDVIEEEYRNVALPHVRGSEQRQVFQRRAAQLFRHTPYSAGQVHGRDKQGRRDDKVLFTALTNPDYLNGWLAVLDRNKAALKGIYSVPMFGETLLRKAGVDSENVLLLTRHQGDMLRQSFFSGRRLKASRLSPCHAADTGNFADYLKNEAEKNQRYLNRLQLLNPSAVLDVYVVGAEDLSVLEQTDETADQLRFHVLDLTHLVRELGLKKTIAADGCEELFVYLAGQAQPAVNYARTAERRYYLHGMLRRALIGAGLAAAMAGMVIGTDHVFSALGMQSEMGFIEQESARLEMARQREVAALPALPVRARDMKAVVDLRDAMAHGNSGPARMMIALSKGMQSDSRIQLDAISWEDAPRTEAQAENGDGQEQAGEWPRRQTALLKGRLSPFGGDLREAFAIIENFAAALRRLPGLSEAETVKMPVDVNPNSQLTGEAGNTNYADAPVFEMKLVMDVGGDEI